VQAGAPTCGVNNFEVSDRLGSDKLAGIIFLTCVISALCVVAHFVKVGLNQNQFIPEPQFLNRLLGSGRGKMAKFGGDPELNSKARIRQAKQTARENGSFDMTILGDVIHNRSKVETMCRGRGIKTDSPLNIGDIPSIFKLLLQMMKEEQIKPSFQVSERSARGGGGGGGYGNGANTNIIRRFT